MNSTLSAILRILEEGKPELQVAASQILGELSPKDTEVVERLAGCLTLGDNTLNRYILQSLAQIGTKEAVKVLVSRLRDGGATADLVRHLLGQVGGDVSTVLADTYDDETQETQLQILQILGHYSEDGALRVLLSAVLGDDETLAKEAATHLEDRLDEISEARRKAYREKIYKRVSKEHEEMQPGALAQGLRLMGVIDAAASRATLLKFAGDRFHPKVRQAALRALALCRLTAKQADDLLAFIEDSDQTHVVLPTLDALQDHTDWSKKSITTLKTLLTSRKEDMKLFALRALRETNSEEVAKVYMSQLHSNNPQFQAAASEALGNNPKALSLLLKSLQHERNADKAVLLVKPLLAHAERIKPAQIKSMAEKCGRLLAGADRLGEVHLEILLGLRKDVASEELVGKATRLRRARKLNDALNILVHLAGADALDPEGRYQLALARLIKDNEEGRAGVISHTGDATMGYIAALVRDEFPVFERLKKESMLEPEDLLRVGRHFNAGIGAEQRMGAEMLAFVAEKHAKAKAGEEARMMIRSEGLV